MSGDPYAESFKEIILAVQQLLITQEFRSKLSIPRSIRAADAEIVARLDDLHAAVDAYVLSLKGTTPSAIERLRAENAALKSAANNADGVIGLALYRGESRSDPQWRRAAEGVIGEIRSCLSKDG